MGIFTPAWKTKNPNKQETAFKYVLRANQPKLCEIAELAPLPAVREKAIPEELRIEAAIYAKDPSVNEAILMNRKLPDTVRKRAVSGIKDEEVLAQFAMSDENHELRKAAVKCLRDRALLQKIRDGVSDLRIDACEKLNQQWEHIYDSRNNGDDVAVYECKYCGERMMMPYE